MTAVVLFEAEFESFNGIRSVVKKVRTQTRNRSAATSLLDIQKRDGENCPLPPMDGFPHCNMIIEWMKKIWRSDPCYERHGVNGSMCSILIYLSEIESWCPVLPGRKILPASAQNTEVKAEHAVIRDSLTKLYPSMEGRMTFKWIHQRILSMEDTWVEAGRSFSAKYTLTQRTAKHILVYPGAMTKEARTLMAEGAFSGGPLGELVQWSDLISTLHILGHHVHLSASVSEFQKFVRTNTDGCPSLPSVELSLIYTDIIGLRLIKPLLGTSWIRYQCMMRVLDCFGTEPDFNHAAWARKHNLRSPYGSLNMIPMQFYTMFPHTPDNTFLGLTVQSPVGSPLSSTRKANQALVYGKKATIWKGKEAYLNVIHKYLDIHGTVDRSGRIPRYVKNHGIIKGSEVHNLLRQSKVFVGLSLPYEGPAPLEALANGCAFLNPRFRPPQYFKGKPTIRELTSQNPYAESIGEPYVWTVDIHNLTEVERALTAILTQTIEPYVPYEFTSEGMLQRVNILIEKQDFCHNTRSWPPLRALQVVKAEINTSCKQACQNKGLICEPAFFSHLNNARQVASYGVKCETSELSAHYLVLPAYSVKDQHCLFQSDALLFSCVRSHESLTRICPCRDYIKEQIALCKACV
ncbi:alpha-1,6-mannosylglycoprotein 6-beta-N-acetylglucosaminyltransferase A-like [Brachionichthys hirsutus]|uniref:alpha-1,6-mannosylglycoprotein 6-beta-N-acetylglucosaminyltransferase A-like n=1 Tax=Brachionichthys hirsutus TaxID=412623 RepID=UPI0036048B1E